MEKALSFLDLNSSFYTLLQDVQFGSGNQQALLRRLALPDGNSQSRRVENEGLSLVEEQSPAWK